MDRISVDEMYSAMERDAPPADAPPQSPPPGLLSYEDIMGPDAAEVEAAASAPAQAAGPRLIPGPLANAPDDTDAESWLKFGLSSVKRGVQSIPGLAGDAFDLSQMAQAGVETGYDYLTGGGSTFAENLDRLNETNPNPFYNSEGMGDLLFNRWTGQYQPESRSGRIGGAMIEGVTGGFIPAKGPRLIVDTTANALAGGSGQTVSEITGSAPAAIAAALATGTAAGAGVRTFEKEGPGMNMAGLVASEAASDPMAAAARLRATENLIPGVNLTSAQKAGDPGLNDLDRRLGALDAKGSGGNNATIGGQVDSSVEALSNAAAIEAQRRARDLATEYGIGNNARTNASADTASVFDAFEKAKKAEVNAAWNAPNLNSARVFTKRAANNITQYVDSMSVPNRGAIPADIMNDVKEIVKLGPQTKLTEWQDLRSKVLGRARETENPNVRRILGEFADVIENTIGDETNIVFKNADAIDEWKAARQATSEYHELFTNPSLRGVTKGKVADEDTLRNLLSGGKAGDNIDALRRAVGPNADDMIQNFLIGELTNNGAREVSLKNIDDFVGKRGNIIDRIPGMKDRIDGIRSSVASNNLSTGLNAAMGDPKKLAAFVDKNRDLVNSLSPSEREFYSQLEASAKRLSPAPSARAAGTKTLDEMQRANVLDVIYSVVSGNTARGASVGAAVGTLAGGPLGGVVGLLAGGAGGVVGNTRARARAMEILQEARTNPELMAKLLEKPTLESLTAAIMPNAARVGVQQGAQVEEEGQVGFADGGLVGPEHFDRGGIVDAITKLAKVREEAADGVGALNRIKAHTDAPTGVIDDWRWRPLEDVHADLGGLNTLPDHIHGFGDYMGDMVNRAQSGGMSARDLVKAYTITRSSIQRGAVDAERLKALGLPVSSPEAKIRPEGAFADWLGTSMGQQYLDRASRGIVDAESIRDAQRIHAPFGKADTDLPDALTWAANNLPGRETSIGDLVARAGDMSSSPQEWRDAVSDVRGIGPSKAGFFASVLGRGDMPTLDARQVILHSGRPTKEGSKFIARRGGLGGIAAVDRLAERQGALGLMMPEKYEPFRQHLTHHAVWDTAADELTTHADVVNAMRDYADGGLVQDVADDAGGVPYGKGDLVKVTFAEIMKRLGVTSERDMKAIAQSYGNASKIHPKDWEYEYRDLDNIQRPGGTFDPEKAVRDNATFMQLYGDKSPAGRELVSINGERLRSPVNQQGGNEFIYGPNGRAENPAAWASLPGAVTTLTNRIKNAPQDGPLYGVYGAMGPEGIDFSTMPTKSVLGLMGNNSMGLLGDVDDAVRRKMKPSVAAKYPGLETEEGRKLLLSNADGMGGMRSSIMKALDTADWKDTGLPDIAPIRWANTDPSLTDVPNGMMGRSIANLNPEGRRITDLVDPHETYPHGVGGTPMPGDDMDVPADIWFSSTYRPRLEALGIDKLGERQLPSTELRLLLTNDLKQKADQQWLDTFLEYKDGVRSGKIKPLTGPRAKPLKGQ